MNSCALIYKPARGGMKAGGGAAGGGGGGGRGLCCSSPNDQLFFFFLYSDHRFRALPASLPQFSVLSCAPLRIARIITDEHVPSSSAPLPPCRRRPPLAAERSMASTLEEGRTAADVELLWQKFFSDPSQWWDKRFDKGNSEAPDFKHKTSKMALWIDDSFSPSWLQEKLATLTQQDPQQPSSTSSSYSSSPSASQTSLAQAFITQLWEEFFSDPSQWWDNRSDKKNPRFPDFKHKTSKKALWIDNRFSPPWVHTMLAAMERGQEHGQSGVLTPEISGIVKTEQLWEDFFSDPSQWWDNRLVKKSPKYPDFKHKSTHKGLWIDGWLNPRWVKIKMATVALDRIQSGGGSRLGAPDWLGNGVNVSKLCQEGRLKEALHTVELMVQQNMQVPTNNYTSLLKGCSKRKSLAKGKRVHALIVESGLGSDIVLGNTLVDMYAKCGSLLDAREVFNTLPEHNVYSWTAIISAYADHGQGKEAIHLFQQMQRTGIVPDKVACIVVLKACASIAALEQGKQLHSHIIRSGFESDVIVGNTLVDMYAKCGQIEDARQLFNKMRERDVVSWNAMIAGYVHQGFGKEAVALYEQMKQECVEPDNVTYVVLLKACASIAALEQGKLLHSQIIRDGFESHLLVGSALVDMYAKCGQIEDARQLFNNMSERDIVSWNVMIAGYAQQRLGQDALALYEQMKQEGVQPDNVTYVVLLNACASMAALEQGRQLHSHIRRSGFESDVIVRSALVDMYAKSGCMQDAFEVFNNIPERDVVVWNAMIAGSALQGLGKETLTLLEQMQREGMKPNEVTYVSVLSACSHSGLVDEARRLFDSMCKDPDFTPTVDHYACIVDLLGRAGCLTDAEDLINKMPIQPDAVVWTSLLGAAKNHGNVEIGRRAFDSLVKLEPENSGAYVLLSNIYAAAGRSDEVANIRKEMKDAGVKKMPGHSWI